MPESSYEGIVVLGAPRSGTTLLRRLLDAHPNIVCPPETNLLGACSRFLESHQMASGVSVGVVSGLGFSGYDEAQILSRLRAFAFQFFRELAARAGKRRWAEKTAFDVFHIDAIERICSNHCRFILLYRHALDVVCSMKDLVDKMQVYLPELHQYICRDPRPLGAFTQAWVDVTQRMRRLALDHPDSCVEVKYEDLVTDPHAQMSRILKFLREETDIARMFEMAFARDEKPGLGDWKTYQKFNFSKSSIGRWKDLDANMLPHLAAIANPALEAIGYPRVPSETDSSDAARKFQLGLLVGQLKKSD